MNHKEEKYRNWVRGGLAYLYLKAGIKGFADDVVQQQHKHILHTVNNTPGLSCNQCCVRDLQPLHKCEKDPDSGRNRCPRRQNICNCLSTKTKPCPSRICDAIMEEILNNHGSTPPRPNWRNTDAQKWCSNPWEIAKCFIDLPGYSFQSKADDFDASALLQMFINNVSLTRHFSDKLNRSDTLKKTLQRRNELFHSSAMEMEDSQLAECIDEIIAILEDEKELKARHDTQEAVRSLKQLKQESFIITTPQESDVLISAVTHVTNRFKELTQPLEVLPTGIATEALTPTLEQIRIHFATELSALGPIGRTAETIASTLEPIGRTTETIASTHERMGRATETTASTRELMGRATETTVLTRELMGRATETTVLTRELMGRATATKDSTRELMGRATETTDSTRELMGRATETTVLTRELMGRATETTDSTRGLMERVTERIESTLELMGTTASTRELMIIFLKLRHGMHMIPYCDEWVLDIIRQSYKSQIYQIIDAQDGLWMSFISGDIETDLLAKEILPSNHLLQSACTKLGRHSNIVSKICSKISAFIKMSTKDIVDTWAAYEYSEYEKNGEAKVIFVVCTTQIRARIDVRDYIIHQRKINTYSSESQEVLAESIKTLDKDYQPNEISELRKCIATHSDSLIDSHSNLNIISPSLKRSRGYGTASRVISDELCIVLYVDVKGFIPIQEEAFPKQLDGIPTDVWEGGFETFTGGPNDTHEHMKMGLAIHAYNTNSLGKLVGGTLGGFVEHPLHGLCGISCSHVLLSGEEMRKVQNGGQLEIQKSVYHPVCYTSSTQFGKVVSAVFKEESSTTGVDVAMFKIEAKFPLKGDFPDAFNYLESGFDERNPLLFNSGDVLDVSAKLEGRPEVYKFGIATGITRGSFGLQGSVIRRKQVLEGQWEGFGYRLKNLIEILAIGGKPFAQIGDSGALVMKEGTGGDSVAIGMVQAGLHDGSRVFVSPICDILKSLGCPLSMKKFNSDSTNSPNMSQRSTSPMQTDV
ncbi:uncharacterized protein LOC123537265 isoform X2 [Mercenaria mercenaria]|uniref:uncharacterized protein LOC123537265 isoform X2 n=1 Tax=Mercenaria mercenaria TaxID=6596 RepID=UPI00234EECF1|nr:uncharacterized protein LOC123537265 isoform X2 [Mercenaria mercenaria]